MLFESECLAYLQFAKLINSLLDLSLVKVFKLKNFFFGGTEKLSFFLQKPTKRVALSVPPVK